MRPLSIWTRPCAPTPASSIRNFGWPEKSPPPGYVASPAAVPRGTPAALPLTACHGPVRRHRAPKSPYPQSVGEDQDTMGLLRRGCHPGQQRHRRQTGHKDARPEHPNTCSCLHRLPPGLCSPWCRAFDIAPRVLLRWEGHYPVPIAASQTPSHSSGAESLGQLTLLGRWQRLAVDAACSAVLGSPWPRAPTATASGSIARHPR